MLEPMNLPMPPKPMDWRRKRFRTSFFKKVTAKFASQFLFELAVKELVLLKKSRYRVPREHIEILGYAFKELFSYRGFGSSRWIDGHLDPESDRFQNLGKCQSLVRSPYIDRGLKEPIFYRCLGLAIRSVLVYEPNENAYWQIVKAAPRSAYQIIDWEEQVKSIHSLLAAYREFGGPTAKDDVAVCNDWLEERGLDPILYHRAIAQLLNYVARFESH